MKKSIGWVIIALIAISLTSLSPVKTETKLDGVWELVNHYTFDGQDVIDTIPPTDGYRQIKMYANGKVMWTRYVPKDSVEWFGYGSFNYSNSELTETLEYGSASMMKIVDTMRVFTFEVNYSPDYFSQISLDGDGNRTISENYRRIK